MDTIKDLSEIEFRVFSQNGEDGIIEWLVTRLPGIPETFVEIGVEDYLESNTRFLLCHREWKGLVIDSSERNISDIRSHDLYWRHDLTAAQAFVTCDNINSLLSDHDIRGDIGTLSIDIDGNDYWVWQAINVVNPWIVIIEYNAVFGDTHALTVPYQADFRRSAAHESWLYYGASIRALERLANEYNYKLLGTNSSGVNAFFLRRDLVPSLRGAIQDSRPRPSRFRESRGPNGRLSCIGGLARVSLIADMVVFDLDRQELVKLGNLKDIHSDRWYSLMAGRPEQSDLEERDTPHCRRTLK